MGSAGSETPSPNEPGFSVTCLGTLLAQKPPEVVDQSSPLVVQCAVRA
jgi:hypothetical protein